MQVSNTQSSSYSYNTNSTSSTAQTNSQNTTSFDSYLKDKKVLANTKLLTSDILSFIDKNNGFSSLSPENEKLFREILADDMISMQEVKNLNYEQAKAFNEFQQKSMNLDLSTYIPVYKYEDDSVSNILLSTTITYDEDFNQAFFETLKNINNTKESNDFYDEVSDSLGYNSRYVLVPEPREEYFAQLMAMEIEKYKDFENHEALMIDYINWEIKDFDGFIQDMLDDYKKRSQNPIYPVEQSLMYKNVFQKLLTLEKNYNEIQNEDSRI
ncbi:MAG: hypothetical protein RBR07_06285 [Arcobacteraceae bacterium]|nr:hypothetical protein [Arcobacteraceae bacterium]